MADIKLSVIVPCYNEEKNVVLLFERFAEVIKREDIEVIFVDNGSADATGRIIDDMLPKFGFAKKVTVQVNRGYGFGLLSGVQQALGEYIGWIHADMQNDPDDTIKGLDRIEQMGSPNKLFLKGSRTNRTVFDAFFTLGMSLFESILFRTRLNDINGQPTLFHRSLIDKFADPPHDYLLDLYAFYVAKKERYEVVRFEVVLKNRAHGRSSWNRGLWSRLKVIGRIISSSIDLKRDKMK